MQHGLSVVAHLGSVGPLRVPLFAVEPGGDHDVRYRQVVAEAILTEGVVQVRLGRLFAWHQAEEAVRKALRSFAP